MKISDIKNGYHGPSERSLRHTSDPRSPDHRGDDEPKVEEDTITVVYPIIDPADKTKSLPLELTVDVVKSVAYDSAGDIEDVKVDSFKVKAVKLKGRSMSWSEAVKEYGDDELDDGLVRDAVVDAVLASKR